MTINQPSLSPPSKMTLPKDETLNIGFFSTGLNRKVAHLSLFIESREMTLINSSYEQKIDLVLGWGEKPNTQKARRYAKQYHCKYASLEDGFIHSVGQGILGNQSCSLVIDNSGIYYNAQKSSDLEILLAADPELSFNKLLLEKARHAIDIITNNHVSKYNNTCLNLEPGFIPQNKNNILLVDQTAGDMSLEYGYADESTFERMLDTALSEHPDANIIIKTHPDVIAGKKKGCILLDANNPRITVIGDNINPIALIKQVYQVYVATSQMGFEALMLGKKVTCFGVPFYAGWGLTDDRANPDLPVWIRRKNKLTVEQVFAAAYIRYTRYVHPDKEERCEIEDILDYFELQQSYRKPASGKLFCFGFTLWKRNYIRAFLQSPGNEIHFVSSAKQAKRLGFDRNNSKILLWASKDKLEAEKLATEFDTLIHYMEDGFIRSVGIGTDLTAPASLVLDSRGIYFDPTHTSDLEHILQTHDFDKGVLNRAAKLRDLLLESEVSKYNLGNELPIHLIKPKTGQRMILVPGQVEDDASIQKGCIDICSNSKLLETVKFNHPDAYIIYKPHPDVVSGNRKGAVNSETLEQCCDVILDDASITDCLGIADEVHTMTSLVGFEGLLRELKVVCYGLPFYSNWGLTEDRHYLKRRNPEQNNKKTLDELVAATLILYPRYINWKTGNYTTPEVIVRQINEYIKEQGGKQANKIPLISRKLRQLKQLVKGLSA